jgi:hypothetical protein
LLTPHSSAAVALHALAAPHFTYTVGAGSRVKTAVASRVRLGRARIKGKLQLRFELNSRLTKKLHIAAFFLNTIGVIGVVYSQSAWSGKCF